MSEQVTIGKNVEAVAARTTLIKLVLFSLFLGIAPISSYFLSQKYIWSGNSTYAAITAVVAANATLLAYIISSMLEDRPNALSTAPSNAPSLETKKHQ